MPAVPSLCPGTPRTFPHLDVSEGTGGGGGVTGKRGDSSGRRNDAAVSPVGVPAPPLRGKTLGQ